MYVFFFVMVCLTKMFLCVFVYKWKQEYRSTKDGWLFMFSTLLLIYKPIYGIGEEKIN